MILLLVSCVTLNYSAEVDGTALSIGQPPPVGRAFVCEGDERLVLADGPALFVASQDLRVTNHADEPWGERFFAYAGGTYGVEYRIPSAAGKPAYVRIHVLLPESSGRLQGAHAPPLAAGEQGVFPASDATVIATDACWPAGATPGRALYGAQTRTTPPDAAYTPTWTHQFGICAVREAGTDPAEAPTVMDALKTGRPYQVLTPLPPFVTLTADEVRFARPDGSAVASSERITIGGLSGFLLERAETAFFVTDAPAQVFVAPLGRDDVRANPTLESFRVVCPLA